MIASRGTQLRFLLIGTVIACLAACTDGRINRTAVQLNPTPNAPTAGLVYAANIKFNGNPIQVTQMKMDGSSLFITGYPFIFMRMEVSPDPESPQLSFAASDNIPVFAPSGQFVVDRYASGALGIMGDLALMSGTFGLSAVSLYETQQPIEVARYPAVDPNANGASSDEAYIYRAIVPHPSLPIFYGFRQSDFVYTVGVGSNGLTLLRRDAYSGNGQVVCCVVGGTEFNGGVYVAFQNAIAIFDTGSDGSLVNPQIFNSLQAVNVASTSRYIYVQHAPTYGSPSGQQYPRGIYVFDQSGANVAFFPSDNFINFAVSPDDTHIYANVDNQSIQIYRIEWTGSY